ncbi:hypothetical protein [Streptomyces sp. SID13031]|uniref:hypothetical protein n=1 Tax=Streptomyces sp. SID13031 TaxID=2706046 RepID=UPI0019425C81|nr:hypothetical protein [Streptomyces sp. SID13031]
MTLSAGTLTACSGGSYCSELQNYGEAVKNFKDLTDPETVDKIGTEVKKLSKSSPDDLKDDWSVMSDYLAGLEDAKGDPAKVAQLAKDSGPKVATAGEAIAQQGKDTCNVMIAS